MTCPKCGKDVAPGTKFCEACGARLDEQTTGTTNQGNGYYAAPAASPAYAQAYRQPVTMGGYILRYLINLIPIVGPLIFFIMLFVWAGDNTKEESFNNWAKSQLVWILISVVVAVLIGIAFGGVFASLIYSLDRMF